LQVGVVLVEHCVKNTAAPVLLQELRDELLEFLLTQQLPKLSSETLVQKMALILLTKEGPSSSSVLSSSPSSSCSGWEPLVVQIEDYWHVQNQPTSLRLLHSLLQELLNNNDGDVIDDDDDDDGTDEKVDATTLRQRRRRRLLVPRSLLTRLWQHECFQNLPQVLRDGVATTTTTSTTKTTSCSVLAVGSLHHTGNQRRRLGLGWDVLPTNVQTSLERIWKHISSLLDQLQLHNNCKKNGVHDGDDDEDDKPLQAIQKQHKLQLALSVMGIVFVAWRHRNWMRRWSKAFWVALLAPVTELVDALRIHNDEASAITTAGK
jgi:hypothetical protein